MLAVNEDEDGAFETAATEEKIRRERLRLTRVESTRSPTGQCVVEVELEFIEGQRVVGRSQGQASNAGELRIAALAAIAALEKFANGELAFELTGIKGLRAFDANIVIVSLAMKDRAGPQRLLGSYLADTDLVRSSVIAVLNATNRVLGNYIATR
jgi:hypothetical protein